MSAVYWASPDAWEVNTVDMSTCTLTSDRGSPVERQLV